MTTDKNSTVSSEGTDAIGLFLSHKQASVPSRVTLPYELWKNNYRQELERNSQTFNTIDEKRIAAHEKIGLVYPAISRHALVRIFAGMVKVTMPHVRRSPEKEPQRGIIRGMSPKSRKRMMEGIAQWLNFDEGRAYFITITYHETWGVDFKAWKRDIEVFCKRMKRKLEGIGGLWKLEFQTRGAPHYHILISGVDEILSEMKTWVTENWADIAHQESEHRGKYATNVRRVYSLRHAQHYCAKYMTKDVPLYVNPDENGELQLIPTGRIWAFFGTVDRSPALEFLTSPEQGKEWKRGGVIHLLKMGSKYADRFERMDENRSWSMFGIGQGGAKTDVTQWRDFIRIRYELTNN